MGCCLSQPETESQEHTSRTVNDAIASPVAPPPQYNERNDYVVESGKSINSIQGESSSDRIQEQQDEKTKPHYSNSSIQPDLGHNNSTPSLPEATLTTSQPETKAVPISDDTSEGWPIIIRSSMAGKDITIHLPGSAEPYWTLYELRQHLEPQLQKIALASACSSSSSTENIALRVRFIYLGKILSENTTLIPLVHHHSSTTPSDSIILDKYGVIQAMVSKMN